MNEISQRDYWGEVEDIAKSVTQEAREEARDIGDRLHEVIDSHRWIIYTYYAAQVMQWTDNADAIEETGTDFNGKSWSKIVGQFAFCALQQDVCEHDAFAADPEEEEESGEEEE